MACGFMTAPSVRKNVMIPTQSYQFLFALDTLISPEESSTGIMSTKHVLGTALIATLALAMMFGSYAPSVRAATAIDGTAKYQGACTPFCTAVLTTGSTNDVIILYFTSVPTPTTNPPTVSDASVLSWGLRTSVANTGGILYEYYAVSAAALVADTITVTANLAGVTGTIYAFGISGANTATPFDPHAGIPATITQGAPSPFNLAITTSNANDMIIGAIQGSSTVFAVAAPNLAIDAQNYATAAISATEYDIVGSSGSYTVSFTSGGPAASELIADAVCAFGSVGCVAGGGGGPVPEFPFQFAMPVVLIGAIAVYFLFRFARPSIGRRIGSPAPM
jgi:hypothetical protein